MKQKSNTRKIGHMHRFRNQKTQSRRRSTFTDHAGVSGTFNTLCFHLWVHGLMFSFITAAESLIREERNIREQLNRLFTGCYTCCSVMATNQVTPAGTCSHCVCDAAQRSFLLVLTERSFCIMHVHTAEIAL